MDLGLKDKTVLITGGTRGIGRAIAEAFLSEGSRVAFCARNAEQVKHTVNKMKASGGQVWGDAIDVTNHADFKGWINNTAIKLNGIDVFVWNVSAQSYEWEKCLEVDLQSCIAGVDAVLPYIKRSDAGAIIAIASQAAMLSVPSYKPYSAVKAALISYMSALSRELASDQVRVNVVSPGAVYFSGGFWERMKTEDLNLYHTALSSNPMGRFCTPQEVACAVVFLASTAASFVSGANLMVDGASRDYVQF